MERLVYWLVGTHCYVRTQLLYAVREMHRIRRNVMDPHNQRRDPPLAPSPMYNQIRTAHTLFGDAQGG